MAPNAVAMTLSIGASETVCPCRRGAVLLRLVNDGITQSWVVGLVQQRQVDLGNPCSVASFWNHPETGRTTRPGRVLPTTIIRTGFVILAPYTPKIIAVLVSLLVAPTGQPGSTVQSSSRCRLRGR